MTWSVRVGEPGDEANLTSLNDLVHALHLTERPDYFKPTRRDEIEAWFRQLLRDPAARIWLAERGGDPVGYVLAILHTRGENPFCRPRRWLEIDQIAVHADHRRAGIARRLVDMVIAEARRLGIRHVEANSWSFNEEAHRVFRHLGLEPKVVRFERRLSDL